MTRSVSPKRIFKALLLVLGIFILAAVVLPRSNYIKKAQVARVYDEMSAAKTAVEASLFEGKIPVMTSAEETQNPDQFGWIGWMGSNMVGHFELNSIKKGDATYWYMVSTFGSHADSLLHDTQLVIFRDGWSPKETCLDSENQAEICQPSDKKTTSNKKVHSAPSEAIIVSSIEEVAVQPYGQWYCRFYIGDKKKLAKEAPRACAIVLDKFQNANQLFVKDDKGNLPIN